MLNWGSHFICFLWHYANLKMPFHLKKLNKGEINQLLMIKKAIYWTTTAGATTWWTCVESFSPSPSSSPTRSSASPAGRSSRWSSGGTVSLTPWNPERQVGNTFSGSISYWYLYIDLILPIVVIFNQNNNWPWHLKIFLIDTPEYVG